MKTKEALKQVCTNLLVTQTRSPEHKNGLGKMKNVLLNTATRLALKGLATQFNLRPGLRKYLKWADGWINFSVGLRTEDQSVAASIIFSNGHVNVADSISDHVDVTLILKDESILKKMAMSTPNELLNYILKNQVVIDGNMVFMQLFNFYLSLVLGRIHQHMLNRTNTADIRERKKAVGPCNKQLAEKLAARKAYRMKAAPGIDAGVKFLTDPYLSSYGIEQFPRLAASLDRHFTQKPEVCPERPLLLTRWFRKNGFETDVNGKPWVPELRQAESFKYLMENKSPVIGKNDLLAGCTTTKPVGVLLFPDAHGAMIWGELKSSEKRVLNPFACTPKTADILHHEVFPFWTHRNFREVMREKYNTPLPLLIDERFVAYFVWKSVGISHTIPDFKRVLEKGLAGIIADIDARLLESRLSPDQKNSLTAMKTSLEGVIAYAAHLSENAFRLAAKETDKKRKAELIHMARICGKVPSGPAQSLDEALNAIWICWIAVNMENTNTGLSIGRLDQLLQPYFEMDMKTLLTSAEKEEYIKHAIEICGCFYMRMTDQVPVLPDIANYLFGGAGSTQAITLGGVTPDGKDAVNDMTYVLLKVTEMLAIRDANVNCRFHPGKNSDHYLKRLCEVNLITAATPIMHNDLAVFAALRQHGYPEADIRNWSATGCVEPTLSGRHFAHTGSILLNLVAAMEMALHNGTHPVMRWAVGPETGRVEDGDFKTFDEFYTAWAAQQGFIIDQAVALNNLYGKVHQEIRPTPYLSAVIDGCIKKGKDLVHGGALYNSSGTSNIGLVDVTDSLLVIKKLVFEDKAVSFERLKQVVDTDFANDPQLLAMVKNRVPLFGSGDPSAVAMANRVTNTIHDCYKKHLNYRGGPYTVGFWSMSQHVAYGTLSGPLPSGRLSAKAFTPGLTPSPNASLNFLDNIRAVAGLDPENMDNNIAFNVKLSPKPGESREKTIDDMHAYVKTYFNLGGMQMQFNVVTSETLKDAMANPENYRSLMVRISGYNAYFVTLNRDIQTELIERTEYGL
ncbi:MAG: formate acetyltransferase [Deltaproteobacteria bacterium]|nr:formate acetyltransferase [Deltaproteobacteria bacterium]